MYKAKLLRSLGDVLRSMDAWTRTLMHNGKKREALAVVLRGLQLALELPADLLVLPSLVLARVRLRLNASSVLSYLGSHRRAQQHLGIASMELHLLILGSSHTLEEDAAEKRPEWMAEAVELVCAALCSAIIETDFMQQMTKREKSFRTLLRESQALALLALPRDSQRLFEVVGGLKAFEEAIEQHFRPIATFTKVPSRLAAPLQPPPPPPPPPPPDAPTMEEMASKARRNSRYEMEQFVDEETLKTSMEATIAAVMEQRRLSQASAAEKAKQARLQGKRNSHASNSTEQSRGGDQGGGTAAFRPSILHQSKGVSQAGGPRELKPPPPAGQTEGDSLSPSAGTPSSPLPMKVSGPLREIPVSGDSSQASESENGSESSSGEEEEEEEEQEQEGPEGEEEEQRVHAARPASLEEEDSSNTRSGRPPSACAANGGEEPRESGILEDGPMRTKEMGTEKEEGGETCASPIPPSLLNVTGGLVGVLTTSLGVSEEFTEDPVQMENWGLGALPEKPKEEEREKAPPPRPTVQTEEEFPKPTEGFLGTFVPLSFSTAPPEKEKEKERQQDDMNEKGPTEESHDPASSSSSAAAAGAAAEEPPPKVESPFLLFPDSPVQVKERRDSGGGGSQIESESTAKTGEMLSADGDGSKRRKKKKKRRHKHEETDPDALEKPELPAPLEPIQSNDQVQPAPRTFESAAQRRRREVLDRWRNAVWRIMREPGGINLALGNPLSGDQSAFSFRALNERNKEASAEKAKRLRNLKRKKRMSAQGFSSQAMRDDAAREHRLMREGRWVDWYFKFCVKHFHRVVRGHKVALSLTTVPSVTPGLDREKDLTTYEFFLLCRAVNARILKRATLKYAPLVSPSVISGGPRQGFLTSALPSVSLFETNEQVDWDAFVREQIVASRIKRKMPSAGVSDETIWKNLTMRIRDYQQLLQDSSRRVDRLLNGKKDAVNDRKSLAKTYSGGSAGQGGGISPGRFNELRGSLLNLTGMLKGNPGAPQAQTAPAPMIGFAALSHPREARSGSSQPGVGAPSTTGFDGGSAISVAGGGGANGGGAAFQPGSGGERERERTPGFPLNARVLLLRSHQIADRIAPFLIQDRRFRPLKLQPLQRKTVNTRGGPGGGTVILPINAKDQKGGGIPKGDQAGRRVNSIDGSPPRNFKLKEIEVDGVDADHHQLGKKARCMSAVY
uniref:Uncharacterized protein n=1 Tax=Chromera velia CCMP2878 TaxID=1169474 RepID=A0A0G4GIW7_9ALVE|eukprot:Cvel_22094.t1-p1 / transcript=Cvel_22094.t1 / gene=Cvel_22094 / organism=Chromera_velia_CCMP2878 / gene_product=hypothetical protein / transcript_product=hypothetical protein / location=Cvel_scaffold2138:2963-11205(+) / protein_length=1187 / sequence_SO=supercontig / SO=protein_coding / is_pseudo=false